LRNLVKVALRKLIKVTESLEKGNVIEGEKVVK